MKNTQEVVIFLFWSQESIIEAATGSTYRALS